MVESFAINFRMVTESNTGKPVTDFVFIGFLTKMRPIIIMQTNQHIDYKKKTLC